MDRSWLGAAAAKIAPRAQVLSYLIVDREFDKITEGPFDLPLTRSKKAPLTTEERRLLTAYHLQIAKFNADCLNPLTRSHPNLQSIIDPLGGYIINFTEGAADEAVLPVEEVEHLVHAFQKHPGFDCLKYDAPGLLDALDARFYREVLCPVFLRIQTTGPMGPPKDMENLFFSTGPHDPIRVLLRRVFALLTLRLSLQNINQVLFQALHSKKLGMFSDRNVVDFRHKTHFTGEGTELVFTVDPQTITLATGDFVGLKLGPLATFATVHWRSLTIGRDCGWLGQAKLWGLDEFFNPHSELLKQF